ncbi:hypothetical protein GGI18_004394, partial [Coemansia linderi]
SSSGSLLSAARWVSPTALSRARLVSALSSTRRLPPLWPSPVSSPRTSRPSAPWSRLSTPTSLRSPTRSAAPGVEVSWAPRPTPRSPSAMLPPLSWLAAPRPS